VKKTLVNVQNLSKYFYGDTGVNKAIDGISFHVFEGETLGIVGESGSGKTTLGRTILRLLNPDQGRIEFAGHDITALNQKKLRAYRKNFQMIFQNPYESLSPRLTVGEILEEPMNIQKEHTTKERTKKAYDILNKVGLPSSAYDKKIHEFSGGQRQRIGIGRVLIMNPKLIIADEPVSALDVSVQAQTLNLLKDLQKEFKLTYIFISHDLSVVHHMSDRVAVLRLGHLLEIASKSEIYKNPIHPYTKSLLSSIPTLDPHRRNQDMKEFTVPEHAPHPPQLVDIGNGHYVSGDVINIKQYSLK
jgi:oligopeptide/dipeptide ABC transporter ATP-binding protein